MSLLEHVSPIGWDNILLYGEYVIDTETIPPTPAPRQADSDVLRIYANFGGRTRGENRPSYGGGAIADSVPTATGLLATVGRGRKS